MLFFTIVIFLGDAMAKLNISAIAVLDQENRLVRGADGLPGRTKRERRWFKRLVRGHAVIMGKSTYEQMATCELVPPYKAKTFVLSQERKYVAPGCIVVHKIGQAALALKQSGKPKQLFVIGGTSLYKKMWQYIDRLYLLTAGEEVTGGAEFLNYKKDFPKILEKKKGKKRAFRVLEKEKA